MKDWHGNSLFDCYRRGLKVQKGTLYGKRWLHDWLAIEPGDICKVREYGCSNPFVKVWTTEGKFVVGALTDEYDPVVQYLKQCTRFDLSRTLVHRYNQLVWRTPVSRFLFGTPVSRLIGKLFGRRSD